MQPSVRSLWIYRANFHITMHVLLITSRSFLGIHKNGPNYYDTTLSVRPSVCTFIRLSPGCISCSDSYTVKIFTCDIFLLPLLLGLQKNKIKLICRGELLITATPLIYLHNIVIQQTWFLFHFL